jgi:hypothetical protein
MIFVLKILTSFTWRFQYRRGMIGELRVEINRDLFPRYLTIGKYLTTTPIEDLNTYGDWVYSGMIKSFLYLNLSLRYWNNGDGKEMYYIDGLRLGGRDDY